MKAVVAAFNQEKALVGAFSVITNLRMELFQALTATISPATAARRLNPLDAGSDFYTLSLVAGDKEHVKSAMTQSRQ